MILAKTFLEEEAYLIEGGEDNNLKLLRNSPTVEGAQKVGGAVPSRGTASG